MASKMPPPTRDGPGLVIAVAPKPDSGGKMPPPGADQGGKDPAGKRGTIAPENAHFIPADKHCIDCDHYDPQTGNCDAGVLNLQGQNQHQPEDACYDYFRPAAEEPDEDDQGGAPDNDADDQQGGGQAA